MQKGFLNLCLVILMVPFCVSSAYSASTDSSTKKKIIVVSSYNREYLCTHDAGNDLSSDMFKFGYSDDDDHVTEYAYNVSIETSYRETDAAY